MIVEKIEKTPETNEETKRARLVELRADIKKLREENTALRDKLSGKNPLLNPIALRVREEQERYGLSDYRAGRLGKALSSAGKAVVAMDELKERAVASHPDPDFEPEYHALLQMGNEELFEAWETIRVGKLRNSPARH